MKRILFVLFTALLSIMVFHKDILRGYAELLQDNSAVEGADFILVIGGSNRSRVPYGIQLFQSGYSDTLLFSTPAPERIYYPFIDSEEKILQKATDYFGVELNRIPSLKKGGATSTFDEAYDTVAYIKDSKREFKRIIVVTDGYHTGRAKYAFEKIFRLNHISVEVQMASVPNKIYTVDNWWKTEKGLQDLIPEGFRYIMYLFLSKNLEAIPNV